MNTKEIIDALDPDKIQCGWCRRFRDKKDILQTI